MLYVVVIKLCVKKGKWFLFYNVLKGFFLCNKIIINVIVNLKLEREGLIIIVFKKYLGK